MPRRPTQRVFCLEESVWDESLGLRARTSAQPVLELLERQGLIEYVHRQVAVRAEFDEYMRRRRRYRGFGVIYLAFHGTPAGLLVGGDDLPLPELQRSLGRADGAVVHLGSCSVLEANEGDIAPFLAATGARVISGFSRDVDWVEAAAFEQILFSYLAHYQHVGTALSRFEERHAGLAEYLQWVCWDATRSLP